MFGASIALKKNSPYTRILKQTMLDLTKAILLNEVDHSQPVPKCNEETLNIESISYYKVVLLYSIFVLGSCLSLVVLIWECCKPPMDSIESKTHVLTLINKEIQELQQIKERYEQQLKKVLK